MGTRGITGFVIDGEVKAQYQQYDSYPSGTGVEVLEMCRANAGDVNLVTMARAIEVVNDKVPPTAEQKQKYKHLSDLGVSNQTLDDWYCLLRKSQGDLMVALHNGVIRDAQEFASDSLFCEWGYLVNLDDSTLEVYEGFQTEPHAEGRFASLPVEASHRIDTYYPIKLVKTYELAHLPTQEEFLADLEPADEDA